MEMTYRIISKTTTISNMTTMIIIMIKMGTTTTTMDMTITMIISRQHKINLWGLTNKP